MFNLNLKYFFLFSLIALSLFSSPERADANTCSPAPNSCDFYRCRESQKACGDQGYYLSFGYKYCQEYMDLSSIFAAKTKEWLSDVRLCLQEELAISSEAKTCSATARAAFKSHSTCYVKSGACDLPLLEFFKVLAVLKGDLLRPEIFEEGLVIMHQCAMANDQLGTFKVLTDSLSVTE